MLTLHGFGRIGCGAPVAFGSRRYNRDARTLVALELWKGVEVWHAKMFPLG